MERIITDLAIDIRYKFVEDRFKTKASCEGCTFWHQHICFLKIDIPGEDCNPAKGTWVEIAEHDKNIPILL